MKTMPIAMLISISFAASPSWGCWWDRPVIKTGIADSMTSPTQLTITGKRFGSAEPIVNLAGLTLVVTAFTPTSVTATLPPSLTPGSYVLTVAKKHERYCIGAFDLTLGAVGPKGDMGAVGPEGSRGPEGPGGPAGFREHLDRAISLLPGKFRVHSSTTTQISSRFQYRLETI